MFFSILNLVSKGRANKGPLTASEMQGVQDLACRGPFKINSLIKFSPNFHFVMELVFIASMPCPKPNSGIFFI